MIGHSKQANADITSVKRRERRGDGGGEVKRILKKSGN
jgi:hypothetical protein